MTAPSVPELPPDAEALRALDALAAQDLPARGEYRAFYIALTLVAKRYLERRLAAPVVEMTSAETLAFLRGHAHGGELLPIVRDLAEAADRIKFANGDGLARRGAPAPRRRAPPGERARGAAASGRDRGGREGGLMDWSGFRFQDPAWLWLALAGPLVLVAGWLRERETLARAVAFPGAARLRRVRPGWRVRLRSAAGAAGGARHRVPAPWPWPARSTAACART